LEKFSNGDIIALIMTIKYPYLPEGRDIKNVSVENQFMAEAKKAQENLSNEGNHPTGSVVVLNNEIVGRAGNRAPLGDIEFLNNIHKNGGCIRRIFKIPTGHGYWVCPGCAKHHDHSEQRAIRDALKNIKDIAGADLYLYGHWWCCKPCWNKIISAGIKDVYVLDKSIELFKKR
jgi:tRNA(Arg) A34 adenosine deaminase TadA